jgi:hypothetical protein
MFRYSPGAYRGPAHGVTMPGISLYFSYETVVAYQTDTDGLVVSENCWGPTTGKHLNWICSDRKRRVKRELFEEKLQNALHVTTVPSAS